MMCIEVCFRAEPTHRRDTLVNALHAHVCRWTNYTYDIEANEWKNEPEMVWDEDYYGVSACERPLWCRIYGCLNAGFSGKGF